MNAPLRILVITNKCPPDFDGGYELRAFQLAQGLRARGHEVDLVTSKFRETFTGERRDPPWVHRIFRYIPVSGAKGWRRHFDRVRKHLATTAVATENVPAMESFLAAHHDTFSATGCVTQPSTLNAQPPYDLAYCFGLRRISFAVPEPVQRRGIPVLFHAGGTCIADHFHFWARKYPGYRLAQRHLTRGGDALEQRVRFDHVAYVSTFLREREHERGHHPRHSYIISRGIDFPLAEEVDLPRPAPPTFFMACRIDEQKGIHHVLTAAGELLRRRPELEWQLEIAGEALIPAYHERVLAQLAREQLTGRVQLLGRRSHLEVIERMRSATAFIFASIYGEPFSSTIIEALACGTPLLGSDDGSILEVVEPGVSALIFRKDRPAELAAHMERILTEPALRRRLAHAGLDTVARNYTFDRILDQTEAAFAEVIADASTPLAEPEPAHA